MNIIATLRAKVTHTRGHAATVPNAEVYVFENNNNLHDILDFRNTHEFWKNKTLQRLKNCFFVVPRVVDGALRLDGYIVTPKGIITAHDDTFNDALWSNVINPRNRTPWYWERKIARAKVELPGWAENPQEASDMRIEMRQVLAELESNFNINDNYYRIQANAAYEAHSILIECESIMDECVRSVEGY